MSEELDKSFKGAIAGMALMAAPGQAAPKVEQPKTSDVKFDTSTLHPELRGISHIESSNGANMAHKAGPGGEMDTAVGLLGLKPQTALETYTKTPHLQKLFPNLKEGPKFVQEMRQNPSFYNALAASHWNALKSTLGSPAKAAYGWRHGKHAAIQAQPGQVEADPYVKKYLEITQKLFGKPLGKIEQPMEPEKAIEIMGSVKVDFAYNYDNLLLPAQVMEGYSLRVKQIGKTIHACVLHGSSQVGVLTASLALDKLVLGDIFIQDDELLGNHRSKGLGLALYEGMFAFSMKLKGVCAIVGNQQTAMISGLMKKLSEKFGMSYIPTYTEKPMHNPGLASKAQSLLYHNDLANTMGKPKPTIDTRSFDEKLDSYLGNVLSDTEKHEVSAGVGNSQGVYDGDGGLSQG